MFQKREKSLARTGIRTLKPPARSQSLYQLSYPDSPFLTDVYVQDISLSLTDFLRFSDFGSIDHGIPRKTIAFSGQISEVLSAKSDGRYINHFLLLSGMKAWDMSFIFFLI